MNIIEARQATRDAINARDKIERPCSPEWMAAHKKARALAVIQDRLQIELSKDPATRHGDWRMPSDIELQIKGYI